MVPDSGERGNIKVRGGTFLEFCSGKHGHIFCFSLILLFDSFSFFLSFSYFLVKKTRRLLLCMRLKDKVKMVIILRIVEVSAYNSTVPALGISLALDVSRTKHD